MKIASLRLYPVKSTAGIEVDRWPLDATGLRFDRRLMVVDPYGEFVTLRGHPRLVTLQGSLGAPPDPDARWLRLSVPGHAPFDVALEQQADGEPMPVRIWGDAVGARAAHAVAAGTGALVDVDGILSKTLGRPVRLAVFDSATTRPVDPRYAAASDHTQFADGFPLLVTTTGSLAELSRRRGEPVSMERFRPNLVIACDEPFAEDRWRRLLVHADGGDIVLELVKPCARCVGVNVEPGTGRSSKEPLATLARFRTRDGQVFFGQNAIHRRATEAPGQSEAVAGVGVLSVGQAISILAATDPA